MANRRKTGESLSEVKDRVFTTRRNNLRKLIDLEYDASISKLVTVLCTDEKRSRASFISQILSGNRQLGERAARSIEVEAGKAAGWLDGVDPRGATARKEAASLRRIAALRSHLEGAYSGDLAAFVAYTGISQHRASYLQSMLDGDRHVSAVYAQMLEGIGCIPAGTMTEV